MKLRGEKGENKSKEVIKKSLVQNERFVIT
jgi:hypothetical protein